MKKAAVIMGSDSDLPVVEKAILTLQDFGVPTEVRVCSAHRTPEEAAAFSRSAAERGFGVIIAAAGLAAHLAGALAANTILPVIGIPMAGGVGGGLDALLSTVMMPPGVPVATVGVGGAVNAALLAVQILALSDEGLSRKLMDYKREAAEKVRKKDQAIREKYELIKL
jgi:5-(carboxyamino)imidazole ribonucleotide mutase